MEILTSPKYKSLPLNKLFIIRGNSKSGKTVYIKQIMNEMDINFYYIKLNELIDHNFIIPSKINTSSSSSISDDNNNNNVNRNILIIDDYYLIEYYKSKISDFNNSFNGWYLYFKAIIIIVRDNTVISPYLESIIK